MVDELTARTVPRVAVAGSGYWGRNLVRNFHALGALEAICDSRPETLQELADKHEGVRTTGSYADLLSDPDIEGIVVATPAAAHVEMVREALLARKDVFVEKPLALTDADGRELARLARERARVLMVGHLLWYHPAVRSLKQLISEGKLGRVQYVYSNRLNMGKLRTEENVLWSFAPHDVSVILGLLDEMPESVQAQGGNFLHQSVADTTVSLLNFASGVRAHIFVSWLHPFKEQKLVIVGSEQMAVFDDTASWPDKLTLYPHTVQWSGAIPVAQKADATRVPLTETEPLRDECAHFLDCVRERARPNTDADEGVRVLGVLNACQQALASGASVSVAKVRAEPDRFFAHDSAVVDAGVEIGQGTKVWHFSHLLSGTVIGEACSIGQNVMIGPDVIIGHNCKIQNNVSLYKGVTLEDGVFCGPSCVFTNVINPRAEVERKAQFQATLVKRGATIGANATIVCGHTLGEYCFIAAGAVVACNVPDYGLMVGVPARRVGWMSAAGGRLGEDLVCPIDGTQYQELDSERLERVSSSV
ncbi:MAG: oxidoreductase [Gammaproteobacteria bacterium]|nr:oxidoreductase [Gammaproteobacteria bacterium]